MQIPQIQIQQTHAQIGLESRRAKIQIDQNHADVNIQQPKADIQYYRRPGKLTIDQTQAWADMNLKSARRSIEEFAAEGNQAALQGIARRAQQGDQLMRISDGGDAIVHLAKVNSEPKQYQVNIGFIPGNFSVKFHYQPEELNINVNQNKPVIDIQPNDTKISAQAGSLDIYMKQKNSINIDVSGVQINQQF